MFYLHYTILNIRLQEESIRWLLINNKVKRAERVLKKAARMNRVNYDDVLQKIAKRKAERSKMMENSNMDYALTIREKEINESVQYKTNGTEAAQEYEVERYNATFLFREKRLFINSVISWFIW